ncbi:MAG: hypothetical protein NTY95_15380 [Bacteroidia bacterium]|nr:hypothetical protein [Bacteroidia bacterium]
MRYRKFGNLDWEVSILGFGTIRLPFKYDRVFGPSVDENNAIKTMKIRKVMVYNYVDVAWLYQGGNSEILVGKTLQEGIGEKLN